MIVVILLLVVVIGEIVLNPGVSQWGGYTGLSKFIKTTGEVNL